MIKIVSLFALISLLSLASDVNMKLIVEKIEKLRNENNIPEKLNYKVYDPFSQAKPILKSKNDRVSKNQNSSKIVIQMILNQKVFIGEKWYSVGNKVQGAIIKSINHDNIIIAKDGKRIKVSIKRKLGIIEIKKK